MIKKKWRWYNKLYVLLKEKFKINVEYSTELKKRLLFSRFLYEQRGLLFLVGLPAIILIFLFAYFLSYPSKSDLFHLNFFDAVAVILTYIGTTALAIIVWHNTWLQKREKENESAIRIYTILDTFTDDEECIPQQNNLIKINIKFTNQNNFVPIKIKFIKTFEINNAIVSPTLTHYISYSTDDKLLPFNETETFTIGYYKEKDIRPRKLYLIFYISNAYDHQVYCIVNCHLDKNGQCDYDDNCGTLIDTKIFNVLKEEFGYDFIKEIVWHSPVGWKNKCINRIHLFKSEKTKEKKGTSK